MDSTLILPWAAVGFVIGGAVGLIEILIKRWFGAPYVNPIFHAEMSRTWAVVYVVQRMACIGAMVGMVSYVGCLRVPV